MKCQQPGRKRTMLLLLLVAILAVWWRSSTFRAKNIVLGAYGSHIEFLRKCKPVYERLSGDDRAYCYCGHVEIEQKCPELSPLDPQVISCFADGVLDIQSSGGFLHSGFYVYLKGEVPQKHKGKVIFPGVIWYVF